MARTSTAAPLSILSTEPKGTTMTDIYTDDGTLDYAEAARTLANLKAVGNDNLKTQATQRITAAALVDIAVSLSAIVTGLATGGLWLDEREVGPDGEPMGDEERGEGEPDPVDERPLEAGDWVRPFPVDLDEASNLDPPSLVLGIGTSEGAVWLDLEHYDDDGSVLSSGVRSWADAWRRTEAPEPSEVETPADDALEDLDPRDLVDDIDSDFDAPTNADEPAPVKVKGGKGKSKSKGGE